MQWDTTGFPKGYQMNDNVKILTLHDLDANILMSFDSSVNLLFFDHYLATYGGKTNPCRLSIFQLACSNDKNSIRLQFIMDTELASSQEDENRTTNLILQSFYPSNLDEIDRHKPYPQIHPSLFTSIFGVDSALSKSYGFMYGHIDGKVRVYSCNMQTSPAVTDIFYDLCQQVKLITAITVPTKHVNSNQSTVNNAILLLGLQGKIVIACRGLIGKDAIGLVFRQYNLFGPILSQCLFQDIDAVDSLLYSSGNDLNIVQFNTGTKPTGMILLELSFHGIDSYRIHALIGILLNYLYKILINLEYLYWIINLVISIVNMFVYMYSTANVGSVTSFPL